jgi:ribosomal-protein-alanine N-acetyltransferase
MRVTIRQFTRRNLPAVTEIERASFGRNAWPAELLQQYSEKSPVLFLIAHLDGRATGYAAAAGTRGWAELVSIAVLPAFRGRGIGAALLAAIIRRAERLGLAGMSLMVRTDNRAARRLYERFGFRVVRTIPAYYEDGRPACRMRVRFAAITRDGRRPPLVC